MTPPGPSGPYPGSSGGSGEPRRGGGRLLLAILAALVVLGLLIWEIFFRGGTPAAVVPEDRNSSAPTGPVWNEKSTPTPSSSGSSQPLPSNAGVTSCPTGGAMSSNPPANGRITGGGISAPAIDGWDDAGIQFGLPWTQDLAAQTSVVYRGGFGQSTWFSVSSVAALPKAEGFTDVRTSASQMMSCFASSSYYTEFTGRSDLISEATTVSGRPAWHLRSEVHVAMPSLPQVAGDVIDVVVVDTGSPTTLGVYISSATIGDAQRQAQVDAARKGLTVG